MLQNSRVTAFTVSELLSQNQDEGTKFTVMGQFGINFSCNFQSIQLGGVGTVWTQQTQIKNQWYLHAYTTYLQLFNNK